MQKTSRYTVTSVQPCFREPPSTWFRLSVEVFREMFDKLPTCHNVRGSWTGETIHQKTATYRGRCSRQLAVQGCCSWCADAGTSHHARLTDGTVAMHRHQDRHQHGERVRHQVDGPHTETHTQSSRYVSSTQAVYVKGSFPIHPCRCC